MRNLIIQGKIAEGVRVLAGLTEAEQHAGAECTAYLEKCGGPRIEMRGAMLLEDKH